MEGTRKVGPKKTQRRERMLCYYMAGSSNFAINYDYSQPAEMCPYNTALNPESTWFLTSLFHPLTALCAHTGLTTMGETPHLLAAS